MGSITIEDFQKVEMHVGTVIAVAPNEKAKKPAYILQIDFGSLGVKCSSAQVRNDYSAEDLLGRQVVAVTNLPPRLVAGVKSEVLVLAAVSSPSTVLLGPDAPVENGTAIS